MKAPEHYRPFNIEHAKAGAPYGCKDGSEATILKWDGRHAGYPLIGIYGPEDSTMDWSTNGRYGNSARSHLDLVMLPLGMCDGKPVFVGDVLEQSDRHNITWIRRETQVGDSDFSISRWPVPEPKYPETRMTGKALYKIFVDDNNEAEHSFVLMANAAIIHAIKSGDVVPATMLGELALQIWAEQNKRNTYDVNMQEIIDRVKASW